MHLLLSVFPVSKEIATDTTAKVDSESPPEALLIGKAEFIAEMKARQDDSLTRV